LNNCKVTGISIDGRVWYAGNHCWVDNEADALLLHPLVADMLIEGMKRRNKQLDADSIIGKLEVRLAK
jgi:hypothetical protein